MLDLPEPGSPVSSLTVLVNNQFYFQWHITERCNRRCEHCYHKSYQSTNELSDQQLLFVADSIEAALVSWDRRGAISITGGEPWLRKGVVLSLIDRFAAGGVVDGIDLLTNGSLLTDRDCMELASRPLLRRVQVSMEGSTSETHDAIRGRGSFAETLTAIRLLKSHGLTVAVMMTLSKYNACELLDLLELLEQYDVDVFAFDRFIPEGQAENRLEWLLRACRLENNIRKCLPVGTKP